MSDKTTIELRVDGRRLSIAPEAETAHISFTTEAALERAKEHKRTAATRCLYWTARAWAAMLALDFDEIEFALTKAALYAKVVEDATDETATS